MIHVSVIPWELAEEELGERLDVAVDKIGIKMCWEAGGANTSMTTICCICSAGGGLCHQRQPWQLPCPEPLDGTSRLPLQTQPHEGHFAAPGTQNPKSKAGLRPCSDGFSTRTEGIKMKQDRKVESSETALKGCLLWSSWQP